MNIYDANYSTVGRPTSEPVLLPSFDDLPKACPKCRAALSTTDSYREYHEKGQHNAPADHIHWECRDCRWQFATTPADAP